MIAEPPPRSQSRKLPPPLPRKGAPIASPIQHAAPKPLPALDMQLLAELPSLTLQARYMVEGFLSGRHRSPQKGSSVEFAEYRDYQFGDDLRRVDWRLYGRTDRLHVKVYEEETQLRLFTVLDISKSMDFHSRPGLLRKIEFARILIAALALIAQRQGDAFGLGIADTELSDFLAARASSSHWRSYVGKLETVVPGGTTSLAKSLEDLAEVIPSRSMVVVASDFYEDLDRLQSALRRLRHDHQEVIALQVLDPLEVDFDFDQSGIFVDVESGAQLKLDAPAAKRGYLERFGKFCSELDEMFQLAGGDLLRLRTDQSPIEMVSHYLARRKELL